MDKNNNKNNESVNKLNLFAEEEDIKRKDDKDINILEKNKSTIESNIIEKNLHEFLNNDLIKALDNDLMDPEENNELSDSSSSNAYNSGSTENNSNSNSLEQNIKLPKNKGDINMNLNCEKDSITNNYYNIQNNLTVNIGKVDNIYFNENIENIENEQINNGNNLNDNIKEKIEILNNPLFAPIVIPKTLNNGEIIKHNEEN